MATDPDSPRRPATSYFTGLADGYDAYRPSYPLDAIESCLSGLPDSPRVADVGCGTGISSRLLAACGASVTGIDPNGDMRRAATEHPDATRCPVRYLPGTAETLPLEDDTVELVLCAQAFHWFDPPTALAEFHRVLVPGGRLALLWNVRQPVDDFSAGYERVVERAQDAASAAGLETHRIRSFWPDAPELFTDVRRLDFDNPQRFDRGGLFGRARSASYFPTNEPLRTELEAELTRLFDAHAVDGVVTLQQKSEVTMATGVTPAGGHPRRRPTR